MASTLSALYPAVTAVIARFALHEQMSRVQLGGVLVALVAVVMIGWSPAEHHPAAAVGGTSHTAVRARSSLRSPAVRPPPRARSSM